MKKIIYLLIINAAMHSANAQTPDLQTTCAASSQGIAGGYVFAYTIGEMVEVQTYKQGNLIISQGILQPDLGKNKSNSINNFEPGEITVFPNPTPDVFVARINIYAPGKVSLYLYDALGQLMQKEEISYTAFLAKKYSLQNASAGMYLLKIMYKSTDGATIKEATFKVIKTAL